MSAPKKPAGGALSLHAATTAGAPPPPPRTPDELELLTAYRGMTPWARSLLLDTGRQYVDRWPQRAKLRLVDRGAP